MSYENTIRVVISEYSGEIGKHLKFAANLGKVTEPCASHLQATVSKDDLLMAVRQVAEETQDQVFMERRRVEGFS